MECGHDLWPLSRKNLLQVVLQQMMTPHLSKEPFWFCERPLKVRRKLSAQKVLQMAKAGQPSLL